MSEEITTDHGLIRAWAEARDGRPGMLERASANGSPQLRFDFGTPETEMTEIAWDEFFTIFDADRLALSYRDTPDTASRVYTFVRRDELGNVPS